MICFKDNEQVVNVDDCERCISDRVCLPWCLEHFVWGKPNGDPLFVGGEVEFHSRLLLKASLKKYEDEIKELTRKKDELLVALNKRNKQVLDLQNSLLKKD